MEKLEKILEKIEPIREEAKLLVGPIYQGLRLVEDKAYEGPTSIRYWM